MTSPTTEQSPPPATARPVWASPLALSAAAVAVAVFVAGVLSLTHGGEGPAGVLAALLRFARYLGTLVAVGGFAFLAAVRPAGLPPERLGVRATVVAAGAGAGAALVALPVQAAYLTGQAASAFDAVTLGVVLRSGFGSSVVVGAAGLALVALATPRVLSAAAVGVGAGGCLLALGAFLLTGHTATSEPQAVTVSASLAHTAAGAIWLGGVVLLPLAVSERRRADDAAGAARLVGRFSTAATLALVAVAVGGSALAWVEVRSWSALATTYGVVLSAKVALVATVAGLGAYNHRRLVPAIRRGEGRPWERLTKVIRLEAAILVGVLAVTAVLVNIVPARVEAGVDAQVVRVAPLGPVHVATVVIEPARPGSNEVHLFVEGPALGGEIADLTLRFVAPDEQEPVALVTPSRLGPGHWLHLGREFTTAGTWRLELAAMVDGAEQSVTVAVPIAGLDEWDGS